MADYYPLLSRAIGGLPDKTGNARSVVYERARRALVAQLRAAEPALAETDIERERQSLEEAIRRVEADYVVPETVEPEDASAADSVDEPAAPAAVPTDSPAEEAADTGTPSDETEESTGAPVDGSETADWQEPEPAEEAGSPTESDAWQEPELHQDAVHDPITEDREDIPETSASEPYTDELHTDDPAEPTHSRTADFEPSEAERVALGMEPSPHAADDERTHDWRDRDYRRAEPDFGALRPGAAATSEVDADLPDNEGYYEPEEKPEARGGRFGRIIGLLVIVALLIGGAVVGYTQRDVILSLVGGGGAAPSGSQTTQAPARPVVRDAAKSTDRIAQADTDTSRASESRTDEQTQGINVAQRAVLFEESPGGGEQGLQQYVGTVVWGTESKPGENSGEADAAVTAEISIPSRNISAKLTLRRNQDDSVPASHIIEVEFDLPPNFDLGAVSSVPGMRAKASEGAQGAPLAGLAVRVAPNFFLIGLSAQNVDIQRNLGLLLTRNWLDLPIVFESGRRAILVLEKGQAGDQAFRQTFAAWGLPVNGSGTP